MADQVAVENKAGIARVTCGWKKPELALENVRPYWRDVHSPAISRRAGIYEYRHYPLDPVRADLFGPVPGIDFAGVDGQQLMWLSDVRYANEEDMAISGASPNPEVIAKILADIEMIVDKSTTYKVIGENGRTFADTGGDPAPQGPATAPTFGIFLRRRGDEAPFRAAVTAMAERWAATPGVRRVRLALFETPDMEAERKAGYPVKTHPLEMQYQAWIDLVLEDEVIARSLLREADAATIATVHAYPAPAVYTFVYNGKPTLSGLRGYMAVESIRRLGAEHQKDPVLLEWMYGDVAAGGASA
ncbi:hypothetical protein HZF05_11975 [Sphingomonas sp. CGMCC 1.13654]|uniref:EthD domain-containing protein n=1 Tax=Sphingomonas chungangi TaxID=2683589 RepID=A0A838L7Z3_9SPHN|nr:EthD domain-containing protein [Sphingomonas chungangi]MBA2934815.1 hypothetical protein [Sphingomonas chungangi]MVW58126.1 hypothetical protein [Sphingomonas chungangi]